MWVHFTKGCFGPSLVLIGPVVLEKNRSNFAFSLLSPFGKGQHPSFEQTCSCYLTQGCIVTSLVEIGTVVLGKKIFIFSQCIFAISLLSPLGKGRGPLFEQNWINFTQNALWQVWLKLTLGSGEEDENVKSLRQWRQRRRQTDNGHILISKAKIN